MLCCAVLCVENIELTSSSFLPLLPSPPLLALEAALLAEIADKKFEDATAASAAAAEAAAEAGAEDEEAATAAATAAAEAVAAKAEAEKAKARAVACAARAAKEEAMGGKKEEASRWKNHWLSFYKGYHTFGLRPHQGKIPIYISK